MAQEQQRKPGQQLSDIANAQREQLFPKNIYSPKSQLYSAQHPNAQADGDDKGRGNSQFLGVHDNNVGTQTDIMTRNDQIKTNAFNKKNTYSVPSDSTNGTVNFTTS